jgi:2-oxoacid:acceptor oxidoreductase gamma subunit (pyruvate/2-ketoisovalerate family)
MIEIRIHGRGGQGGVVASQILARVAFRAGMQVQVFPQFGVERRGAPVLAFARLSPGPIRLRCQIQEPHHVMVLDESLLEHVDVTAGLRPGGWVLINGRQAPGGLGSPCPWRLALVDASGLAAARGVGTATRPIVNTAMVAAFARVTGLVSLEQVEEAIRETVGDEANVLVARDAWEAVREAAPPRGRRRASAPPRPEVQEAPLTAISTRPTRELRTGSWRYLQPRYQELTPPCSERCPVGNDWPVLMPLVAVGEFAEAARRLLEGNPFPAVLGRVCPRPCEQPCNRKALGGAVQIRAVERFLGDYALSHDLLPTIPTDRPGSVAVVGAGPAGLSAAYFLRRLGYEVTVYEKEERPGGLLWSGVPPFRLEREVLDRELERFPRMGIRFRLGQALGRDFCLEDLRREQAAVVLACGLGRPRRLGVPGEDHPCVLDGTRFLRAVFRGETLRVGPRVVVVGGGNTALDCARVLVRLGCQVTVAYRRSRREMPAFREDVAEALEEGIAFAFQVQPVEVLPGRGLRCQRVELGERDSSGRARPLPVEGSYQVLEADTVVCALGDTVNAEDLGEPAFQGSSVLHVDAQGLTCLPEVYACGDGTGVPGTVAHAIASARQVAYSVHARLARAPRLEHHPLRRRGVSPRKALFKDLNAAYFRPQPPWPLPLRPAPERVRDFAPVAPGLGIEGALFEARRCFSCGACTRCDNCRVFCPDGAVVWTGREYRILGDYCKGCGVCARECPRCAIQMVRS